MNDGNVSKSEPSKIIVNNGATWWQIAIMLTMCVGAFAWIVWQDKRDVIPPAPVVVVDDLATLPDSRIWITKNGKTLSDEEAKPIKDAVRKGNGIYGVTGYPDGKAPVTKQVIIAEVAPPQPPNPIDPVTPVKPLPDGFAGEVAKQAAGKPKVDCVKLAENYQTVASIIAAGGITKLEDAVVEIEKMNKALNLDKPTWTPFAEWIGREFTTKAKELSAARIMMRDASIGLNYAGGK